MKALTLQQPWAWAILKAGKDIENRTWPPPHFRAFDRIVIHAGKTFDYEGLDYLVDVLHVMPPRIADIPRGALVGFVRLHGFHWADTCLRETPDADMHPDGPHRCSRWGMSGGAKPVAHWQLRDAQPLIEPIPCTGAQGLWKIPPEITIPAVAHA